MEMVRHHVKDAPQTAPPRASGGATNASPYLPTRLSLKFPLVASLCQRGSIWDEETDSQQGRRCRNFAITVAGCARAAGLGDLYIVLYGADSKGPKYDEQQEGRKGREEDGGGVEDGGGERSCIRKGKTGQDS